MSASTPAARSAAASYVLALNAGSSSLKASVLSGEETIVSFLAERLNDAQAALVIDKQSNPIANLSHKQALQRILDHLRECGLLSHLVAIGHRVVHGGTTFKSSVIVKDDEIEDQIKAISHLAPLHNPHNLAGIKTMRELLPSIPNVAVFDTSFHSTMSETVYTYPLPKEYRDADMRKFGFHGTSVRYVALKAQEKTTNTNNFIVCHLGNGASVTAVSRGKSKETSMGFTPLSGLMMGTRCGSVDPSIIGYACETLDKSVTQVMNDLNKRSGLLGMAGNNDMRAVLNDPRAKLAVDMFVYRLAQHVASFLIALEGPLDAVIFTAGIGEHSAFIRQATIEQLQCNILKTVELDPKRNERDGKDSDGIISKEGTWPLVMVIPTNEEVMIAKECLRLVEL